MEEEWRWKQGRSDTAGSNSGRHLFCAGSGAGLRAWGGTAAVAGAVWAAAAELGVAGSPAADSAGKFRAAEQAGACGPQSKIPVRQLRPVGTLEVPACVPKLPHPSRVAAAGGGSLPRRAGRDSRARQQGKGTPG